MANLLNLLGSYPEAKLSIVKYNSYKTKSDDFKKNH